LSLYSAGDQELGNGSAGGAGADAGAGRRHRRHCHRDRVRTEEDSRRVQRWRRDKERWQRFWAKAVVRDVPASRRTGRLVRLANLLHLGEGEVVLTSSKSGSWRTGIFRLTAGCGISNRLTFGQLLDAYELQLCELGEEHCVVRCHHSTEPRCAMS